MTKIPRLTILFVVILAGIINCKAQQSCNLGDGDTVQIFSTLLNTSDNTVSISVGNDSKEKAANVTITVEVTYKWGSSSKTREYTVRGQVGALQTKDFLITIDATYNTNYKPVSVKPVSITGAKCQ